MYKRQTVAHEGGWRCEGIPDKTARYLISFVMPASVIYFFQLENPISKTILFQCVNPDELTIPSQNKSLKIIHYVVILIPLFAKECLQSLYPNIVSKE